MAIYRTQRLYSNDTKTDKALKGTAIGAGAVATGAGLGAVRYASKQAAGTNKLLESMGVSGGIKAKDVLKSANDISKKASIKDVISGAKTGSEGMKAVANIKGAKIAAGVAAGAGLAYGAKKLLGKKNNQPQNTQQQ